MSIAGEAMNHTRRILKALKATLKYSLATIGFLTLITTIAGASFLAGKSYLTRENTTLPTNTEAKNTQVQGVKTQNPIIRPTPKVETSVRTVVPQPPPSIQPPSPNPSPTPKPKLTAVYLTLDSRTTYCLEEMVDAIKSTDSAATSELKKAEECGEALGVLLDYCLYGRCDSYVGETRSDCSAECVNEATSRLEVCYEKARKVGQSLDDLITKYCYQSHN